MTEYKSVFIPVSFDLIFLRKKNKKDLTIILYNKNISITIACDTSTKLDLEIYCIKFKKKKKDKILNSMKALNEINKYLKTFEIYFFIKIKFKGKGFKIKFNKKIKLIKFYFGRSHMTFVKLKRIKLKKITKYKFLIKSMNLAKLKRHASNITYIKPVNLYTLRGIRVSRQLIQKRKGKKSSYM